MPPSPVLERARLRRFAAVAIAALALALAGCTAPLAPEHGPQGEAGDLAGPHLADVTPIADPGAHEGPSTARLAEQAVDPVAADPTPTLPVTVLDAQGTDVTVTDTSRVLALDVYGTLSRTVLELGLGASLVGRDVSSDMPELAHLPLVTSSGHDLSAEAILDLAPTVIVTDTTLGPWDVILQIREAGIPVVVLDSTRSLETSGELIREVAQALGVPAEGDLLAERTEQEIAQVQAHVSSIAPPGDDALSVAFLYARGSSGIYYLFGGESGTGSLITSLGARDIATESGWSGMRPVTDEGIIAMQPDVLLVMTKGLESTGGVDGLLDHLPALAETPAGQHRRIIDMADAEILAFGPLSARVLEALAVALYAPDGAGDPA